MAEAELIYTLIPGNGWNFDGENDYLDGCAIYEDCYGVSGACGTGELGGFKTNTGDNCLSIGTFDSTLYVVNRAAQWLMNTTNMEYMIIDVITGNDSNGGERPNNPGESLYLQCVTGGSREATLIANSGRDGGYTYPDVDGDGAWTTKTVTIPANNRGLFLWKFYAYSVGSPEFSGSGGIYSSNVNAGDRYGISRIRIYGTVPTHIQYFRGNDNSDDTEIYPGDPLVLAWSTKLGNFAGATSGVIKEMPSGTTIYTIPSGELLEGTYTLNPGPSAGITYRLEVQGSTGAATKDLVVTMLAYDEIPDDVTFDTIPDAEVSTVYDSNPVTISGLEIPVTAISTNGSASSKNGQAFTTDDKTLFNDDTYQLRMTSSAIHGAKKIAGVLIGNYSTKWVIQNKTEPVQLPNEFKFIDEPDAPTETYVLSNEVTITGITQTVPVSAPSNVLDGFESRVNPGTGWEPWSADPKEIANGQKLQLRVFTSDILGDQKQTTIGVGAGPQVPWTVSNVRIADSNPDFFNFEDKFNQPASTAVDSDTLTITGINIPATVKTTNGALISIDGSGFGTSPAQISKNQTLQIRITSSPDPGGEVSTVITIGTDALTNLSDTWKVFTTTDGDIDPKAFYFINKDKQPQNTLVYSNVVQIFGITSPSPISTTGGEMQINGGPWITSGTINNKETLRLRMLSSASLDTPVSMSIIVGQVGQNAV